MQQKQCKRWTPSQEWRRSRGRDSKQEEPRVEEEQGEGFKTGGAKRGGGGGGGIQNRRSRSRHSI